MAVPGGSVVKKPPANAGDTGDVGLIPGSGRVPGGRNGNPLQHSCLQSSRDRGWATVHAAAKSWTWLSMHAARGACIWYVHMVWTRKQKAHVTLLQELRVGACPLLTGYTNIAVTLHLGDSNGPDKQHHLNGIPSTLFFTSPLDILPSICPIFSPFFLFSNLHYST